METPFYLHISIVRACTLYSYTIYIMMAWVMANPPFLCNIYIYIYKYMIDFINLYGFMFQWRLPAVFPMCQENDP